MARKNKATFFQRKKKKIGLPFSREEINKQCCLFLGKKETFSKEEQGNLFLGKKKNRATLEREKNKATLERTHILKHGGLGENTHTWKECTHTHTQTSKCNKKNRFLSLVFVSSRHDAGGECKEHDTGGEHDNDTRVRGEWNDGNGKYVHPNWRISQGAAMALVLITTWCSNDIGGEHDNGSGGECGNGVNSRCDNGVSFSLLTTKENVMMAQYWFLLFRVW
jgi:hypothetical protein